MVWIWIQNPWFLWNRWDTAPFHTSKPHQQFEISFYFLECLGNPCSWAHSLSSWTSVTWVCVPFWWVMDKSNFSVPGLGSIFGFGLQLGIFVRGVHLGKLVFSMLEFLDSRTWSIYPKEVRWRFWVARLDRKRAMRGPGLRSAGRSLCEPVGRCQGRDGGVLTLARHRHGCWDTFYICAYCGLVGNHHLTAEFYFLLPFQRQPSRLDTGVA